MIGYHYTTREKWETIQYEGLYADKISSPELEKFREAMPDMLCEAVWVWKGHPGPKEAWIITTLLAERHQSFDLVLLEVNYEDREAMSRVYRELESDTINLTCEFEVGRFATGLLAMELLIDHIPSDSVRLVQELNLLEQLGELCLS